MPEPPSNPNLYPISVESAWGFIDATGRVVIPPQFRGVSRFSEGLAQVTVAGLDEEDQLLDRSGFIDERGSFVIGPGTPPGFSAERPVYSYKDFHEGLAIFWVGDATGTGGFIDRTGQLVIPPKFARVDDFSEGLACVSLPRRDGSPFGPKRTGFINAAGEFVIPAKRSFDASRFSGGLCVFHTDDDDVGVIDRCGKTVVPPGVYTGIESFSAGLARVVKNRKVGCIDRAGNVAIPLEFDQLWGFEHREYTTAERGGQQMIIDRAGKCVAELVLRDELGVSRLCGGMIRVHAQNRVGYANLAGQLAIPLEFDRGEDFKGELALVQQGNFQGYIDQRGKFVWKTDRWELPCRNSLREPLVQFLPPGTIESLPLEYDWDRIKNAIVFVANDSLVAIKSWFTSSHGAQFDPRVEDAEPGKLCIDFSNEELSGSLWAVEVPSDEADNLLSYLGSKGLQQLIERHQPVVAGVLLQER